MASPNVLLICVDHWPGLLMGAAGHDRIQTPTLNQLAANGVRFSQAYTSTPTCIPARRALMTGTTARGAVLSLRVSGSPDAAASSMALSGVP